MLLSQPARPNAGSQVTQWLRFADAMKRITQNRLDQVKSAQGCFAIDFDPITQIFAKLWVEDSRPFNRVGQWAAHRSFPLHCGIAPQSVEQSCAAGRVPM